MKQRISTSPDVIASLDGIRAVAIGLVFLAHGGLSDIVPGGLGVTLFFVLSGYLITTLMRVEYADTGSLDLPAFYLRRLLRLMPPLLLVLLLALLLHVTGLVKAAPTVAGVVSVIFYFGNYFAIFHHFQGMPDGMGITWSLAVEEHFYIVFPVLALLLLRFRRAVSVIPLVALCAATLVWRCWLVAHGASDDRIYMATDTRIDAILTGCVMALLCNPVLDPVPSRVRQYTGAICVAALGVLVGTLLYRSEYFRQTYRYTIQSLAVAPLIYLAVAQSRIAAFRWLNAGPVVYLGKISYTVYLTHQAALFFINEHWPRLREVGTMVATALLVLAIAAPMRQCVEIPFARLRKRLHQRRHAAAPKVAAMARVKTDN
jgi:peptidoglycan/LPS O-acetylase OafA/YrhL